MALAVAAIVPYVTLKLRWLAGSTVGVTSADGLAQMHSARFVAGNTITVALVATAGGFVVALTRPWADRVPAPLVFVLGAGATGLLAPILTGLPLGLAVQVALGGDLMPAEEAELAPWVFGVVYSGFGLLGLAMAVLGLDHVRRRWGHLLDEPPTPPSRMATVAGAAGLVPFAAAMTAWGVAGVGDSGPRGMTSPAQRTVLVVSGLLAAAAYAAPLAPAAAQRWPRTAWLLTWTGCCVAAMQGPAQVLLAQGGRARPVVAAVAALSAPGAGTYGLGILRRRLQRAGNSGPQRG
jgi:hypothetical protein